MMKGHFVPMVFLALWPMAAVAGGPSSPGADARAILQTHCASCHGGGKAVKGGFGFVLDRDQLVSRLFITPGKAGQSDLFQRIEQGEMPPKSVKTRLKPAEIKTLERWINAGAPPFDAPGKQVKTLTPGEITEIVLADLQKIEPRRQRFTRYLTLNHLALAGRSAKELDVTREAVGKLVNSLSWHSRLARPEAVDADATILRIDLRSYKWTASQWEKLVFANPYRLQTAAESKALASAAGTEFPALRADWFVATAARPPFYHDLLQLPNSDKALERLLNVDVAADIQDDNILRAGFNDSGVSKNNRLLERHDAAYGTYWRSYDFSSNSGRQNLFEHPIGPNTGAVSFQPAGGEMIFHLPNGLQAYMLVDGKGKRIDKGPIEIVADPRRPDQKVETGISCMSCHARGLLFKADQLRGHVEKNAAVFGKQVVDTVRATYPRKAKFQAQIDEDNVRYHKALGALAGRASDGEAKGVRDPEQEPVNLVTLRFEATLDGRTAAAELGLTVDQFEAFLKQDAELARIFGALLVKGGTAQRSAWQEKFPESARRLLAIQAALAAKSTPKLESAFAGHTGTVLAIAFALDGKLVATGSDDRAIRIWDFPSGKLRSVLEGKSNAEVQALAFSANGKFVLSAGRDRNLTWWDVKERKPVRVFERGHTADIRSVALSDDGKWAASGGDDRAVRIWDVATGAEKFALVGHTEAVSAVVFSKDGDKLLSVGRDGTVRWWNVAQKKQIAVLEGHVGPVLCADLSPDGKWAITGGIDRTIRLWSLPMKKELHAFKGHQNEVVSVRFHPQGREFFSATSQHRTFEHCFRLWDTLERKELAAMKATPDDSFGCAAISPDGRHALVGGPAGFVRLLSW